MTRSRRRTSSRLRTRSPPCGRRSRGRSWSRFAPGWRRSPRCSSASQRLPIRPRPPGGRCRRRGALDQRLRAGRGSRRGGKAKKARRPSRANSRRSEPGARRRHGSCAERRRRRYVASRFAATWRAVRPRGGGMVRADPSGGSVLAAPTPWRPARRPSAAPGPGSAGAGAKNGHDRDHPSVTNPPPTTLGTTPKIDAATPLSNAPSSFDPPMNT